MLIALVSVLASLGSSGCDASLRGGTDAGPGPTKPDSTNDNGPVPDGKVDALADAVAVDVAVVDTTMGDASPQDAGSPTEVFFRPFPLANWLYQPIPSNPKLDPASQTMVNTLASGQHVANLHEFAIPFYKADSTTPVKQVTCTKPWGTCLLEQYSPRPLTVSMLPHSGSDGAMVVIDVSPSTGGNHGRTSDEYWQYSWNGGSPTTSWGGISDLDGDGRDNPATGAGISRAAGVVRELEVQAGKIEHALVFSTTYCAVSTFRYPAAKTDGKYSGQGAIPEGARIQLNPNLNPNSYGLNAGERAVFVALQLYGAYAMDCGGAAAAFSFEEIPGNPGATYTAAGFGWDYYGLEKIPWDQMRVLASWNGK